MTLKVGSRIKLKVPMLGNEAGTIGVVYEHYNLGWGDSFSIIFPNGNYDGFSPDEQKDFLEYVDECLELADYDFFNVIMLTKDFDRGKFNVALMK